MKRTLLSSCLILLCICYISGQNSVRQIENFTQKWRFKKLKTESTDSNFSKSDFNDSEWRVLDLPHDWGIEEGFNQSLENNTGLLPWKAIGWYRKSFEINGDDLNKQIFIEIDGAMAYADVYCNGNLVGSWPYGYTSFSMNLTPYIKKGSNQLAIKLNTQKWDSRWYPGAGLYRSVRLVKTNNIHVSYNGLFITTPFFNQKEGRVNIHTTIQNLSGKLSDLNVETKFYEIDINDKVKDINQGINKERLQLRINESFTINLEGKIKNPKLWSIENPNRYLAEIIISQNGKTIDTYKETFGIRSIEFTPRSGFLLNGKRTFIKGVNNHHDLGPLGGAFYTEAAKRQLVLLKEMGCNAIRTSHNPPARELLDLCDKLGFVVQVEAFDTWRRRKLKKDYHKVFKAQHYRDLESMVKRDRNHPSVVMWSTGNEVPDQADPPSSYPMRDIVKLLDPNRPVTNGGSWDKSGYNGFQKGTDIYSYTYRLYEYKKYFANPDNKLRGVFSAESASTLSTRGEYFYPVKDGIINTKDHADFQVSSYDNVYPGWANSPDAQFKFHDKYPAVYGEFVWTGFDYLGEPTPYNNDATNLLNFTDKKRKKELEAELKRLGKIEVPSRSSYFGIFDLAGFKKDRYYYYQSQWRPELPMAHILPHWNWKGKRNGKVTPVHVYTSGDEAELFLNGKSLGKRKKDKDNYRLRWDNIKYKAGTLKVITYKNGKKWAEDIVSTTGKARKTKLTVNTYPVNKKQSLYFITIDITDSKGRIVPDADIPLEFKVSEGAEIIATDNGDPTSHNPFISTKCPSFNGKCLVIVKRITTDNIKKITFSVKGRKVKSSSTELK